jgi:hypothetical protein
MNVALSVFIFVFSTVFKQLTQENTNINTDNATFIHIKVYTCRETPHLVTSRACSFEIKDGDRGKLFLVPSMYKWLLFGYFADFDTGMGPSQVLNQSSIGRLVTKRQGRAGTLLTSLITVW